MARGSLLLWAADLSGNAVPSAVFYVFKEGTWNGSTSSPTGTAVPMYTTASGGSGTTNPLTAGANGVKQVWTYYHGPFDVVCTTNGASSVEYADFRKTGSEKVLYVDADADTNNNTEVSAALLGTKDYPYAGGAGLIQCLSDHQGAGTNGSVPIEIIVYGSSGTDTSPSTITLTETATLGIGTRLRSMGGGDADRERAALLITGSLEDAPLIKINGRFVHIEDIAISNTHTTGRGIDVPSTNPGGGFQNVYMRNVHVYDCGSTGLTLQTFNVDQTIIEDCKFLWNGRSTDAYGIHIKDSDGTPDSSPNSLMFINCESAHNSKGGVGLIQGESNPTSGDVAYFINHKGHGSRPRFDIQGWHNVVIDGYYLETNAQSQLDTDAPVIKVRDGTGGSADASFYTYGLTIRGRGRIHGANRQTAASTTLTAAIATTTVTTLAVAATAGFPSVGTGNVEPFTITIDTEKMRVVSMSSGSHLTWTVIRGVDGTTAATHLNGATVDKPAWTAGVGIVLDIDECVDFDVSGMEVMGADSTSDNPHIVTGTNATRGRIRQGIHTAGEDRESQITTFANLFSLASETVNLEWWDGTNVRSVGNKAGEIRATATWNPANLAAVGDVTTTTVTATGARAGDSVEVSHDAIGTNKVIMYAWVSGDDTVTVLLQNQEGVNLNIASGQLTVRVRRVG